MPPAVERETAVAPAAPDVDRGCAVAPVRDPAGALRLGADEDDGADRDTAPPPEFDPPDDEPPELAPDDEPARDWACPAAKPGRARDIATTAPRTMRVVLFMMPSSKAPDWNLPTAYSATLLPVSSAVNGPEDACCSLTLSSSLALASGRHYDAISGRFSPVMSQPHATTVLGLRHQGKVVLASDGQVTLGQTVVKHQARKVRRLYHDKVLAGFAGAAADGFALFSRFESKLEEHRGNLERAAVELARDWRTDRALRRLEAMMLVADSRVMYLLSGTGDLIEPDDGVIGIGSGGPYAMAAARALVRHSTLDARAIAEQAMAIAADICIYTNQRLTVEEL